MDFAEGGWRIIDDTGFPKKGKYSVGVARQYCGMPGKCPIPYDHSPIRSWPLLLARDVMRGLIEWVRRDQQP